MQLKLKHLALVAAFCAGPTALYGQFDFNLGNVPVQIHSFAQQGFTYSNDNNYLTMPTSQGSFAMTDAGVNISATITDKFRVGAQVYDRNIGALGDYHPQLDWAFGDYKFKDWFGIRAGKVKTVMGLFNDTQDMEFLQTFALLPQGVYPLDLRSTTIAHTGGDLYGEVSLRKAGSVSYTAYAGLRANDTHGGTYYGDASAGVPVQSFSGRTEGMDIRWHTPVDGLMVGGSWANLTENVVLSIESYGGIPLTANSTPEHMTSGYADYVHGKWHFNTEYRRDYSISSYVLLGAPGAISLSTKAWFGTVAYRVTKRLEVGAYNSRFYIDTPLTAAATPDTDPAANHIFDQTIAARFDVTKWMNVKIEEHFINGYGDAYAAHGFYAADNLNGLKPNTNMFVIRAGFYR
jgi:hypothetical protein